MTYKNLLKFIACLFLLMFVIILYRLEIHHYLSLVMIKKALPFLHFQVEAHPLLFTSLYMFIFIAATSISIPSTTILTLLGGALFPWYYGIVLASIACNTGATCSLLISRVFFREAIKKKYEGPFHFINGHLEKEGALYLLSLRLMPVFPFFLVNLVMGLSTMKARTFFLISQLGTLPMICILIFAGKKIAMMTSFGDIVSPGILMLFSIFASMPLIGKWSLPLIKKLFRK